MSQVTISGAVSGLDTASLINQLVSVQTSQQTLLQNQQSAIQKRATAFGSLATTLNSLSTTAADLAKTSTWKGSTATSSSTAVTATITATTSGSLTFDVTALATSHGLVTSDALAGLGDQAASGPLTLTKSDGTATSIEVGSGSLNDVVKAINAAKAGVVASAVQTAPGAYRLQVTSSSTGSASQFTLDGLDGFTGTAVLAEGADAQISIGSDAATAYTVTSASNTFSGVVPGLQFTVNAKATGVTVSAAVDGSSVADKIATLVTQTNSLLSDIASKTVYDATTKTAGVFTGETSVRQLQQGLLTSVSSTTGTGVQVTRDGRLTFDRQAFLTAFAADPAGVATAFGGQSAFSASSGVTGTSAQLSNSLKTARTGDYALEVTAVPAREQWSVATGGDLAGQTLTLTRGTTTLSYTAATGLSPAGAATALNSRLAAAGFGVTAAASGNTLVLTAESAGASLGFTPDLDGVPGTQDAAGTDVVGSIDGQTATGLGSVLSLPTGTGGAVGLSIDITTTAADVAGSRGAVGTFAYRAGLAQRLVTLVGDATSDTGGITTAQDSAKTQIQRYQNQIDAWDDRLTNYRQTLTRQFTAMETALAKLKSSTAQITSMLGTSTSSSSTGTTSTSS